MADGLRRLDGVADVTVDLQQNLCTITPDPTRLLQLWGIAPAVRQAGFRPARLWIEANGTIARGVAGPEFTIRGGPMLELEGAAPSDGPMRGRVELQPLRLVVEEVPR